MKPFWAQLISEGPIVREVRQSPAFEHEPEVWAWVKQHRRDEQVAVWRRDENGRDRSLLAHDDDGYPDPERLAAILEPLTRQAASRTAKRPRRHPETIQAIGQAARARLAAAGTKKPPVEDGTF